MNKFIGYQEAFDLTLSHVRTLQTERRSLIESTDYTVAEDMYALVNSPSSSTSLKDGYAVRSEDIADASPSDPVELKLLGVAAAGTTTPQSVEPQIAVRILTGAVIPEGADAVVSEEYTHIKDDRVTVFNQAEPGRNILSHGSDVSIDDLVVKGGSRLSPSKIGILAAAGHDKIKVIMKPRVAILATGDEVLRPGQPISKGKLYASNMVTLNAWCKRYALDTSLDLVGDDAKKIGEKLNHAAQTHDAVLTSGGAWSGDRDLVARTLKELGWRKVYHRVRMGPGKGIGFGFLYDTPVFILPGGPPSNLMAFLQLALPGLLKLAGYSKFQLSSIPATLSETVNGRIDWTQFISGKFEIREGKPHFHPLRYKSRLKSMAEAEGIISIPEGTDQIPIGTEVLVALLD